MESREPAITGNSTVRPLVDQKLPTLEQPISASLTTATGQVHFEQRILWFLQPTDAWSRLQEFHRRSLGQSGGFVLAAPQQLTAQQARDAFRTSLVCALGQFAVIPNADRQQLFSSLLQYASHTGSFDGLEFSIPDWLELNRPGRTKSSFCARFRHLEANWPTCTTWWWIQLNTFPGYRDRYIYLSQFKRACCSRTTR